jgi:uncharacterized cupin superfamily protein
MSLQILTEPLSVFEDPRGKLLKAWPRASKGEVYVVELLPGHPRGNHLHHHGGEWFIPLSGDSILVVEDPQTKERAVIPLKGIRARVEPGQAHALFAASESPALVMAVADLVHEEERTSSYPVAAP